MIIMPGLALAQMTVGNNGNAGGIKSEELLDLPKLGVKPDSGPKPVRPLPPSSPAVATDNTNTIPVVTHPSSPLPKPDRMKESKKSSGDAIVPPASTALLHNPKITIMLSSEEMDIVDEFVTLYDSKDRNVKNNKPEKGSQEDLLGLFNRLAGDGQGNADNNIRKLPNLYLGLILYHSPSEWVVTLNGKAISTQNNRPDNEFYIRRISRREVELVWKPDSMQSIANIWRNFSGSQKKALHGIAVDEKESHIILLLKPNQTFDSGAIAIREGFVKSASGEEQNSQSPQDNTLKPVDLPAIKQKKTDMLMLKK